MIGWNPPCKYKFSALLIPVSCFGFFSSTLAKGSFNSLASGEQASFLELARQGAKVGPLGKTQYLDDIENVIKSANSNAGVLDETFRRPVSKYRLGKLQLRAWARGQLVSFREISAATDNASALMREIGPFSKKKSLVEKIKNFNRADRPGFHGNVAELAEARARGNNTVLTKSKQSKSWDLTQAQKGPRNYQIKIYSKVARTGAFKGVVDDILDAGKINGKYKGRGIITSEDLKFNQKIGKVKKIGGGRYVSTKHPGMIFEKSKVFSRPGHSVTYYKEGIKSLKSSGLDNTRKDGSFNGTGSREVSGKVPGLHRGIKVLGWIGIGFTTGYQSYVFYKWHHGKISNREGITVTASLLSGFAAGWAGASAGATLGAKAGAAVGGLFGGAGAAPGALIGGLLGGLGGGMAAAFGASNLAEFAANTYYEKLDEKQTKQVEQYIYNHYVTP